MRGVEVGAPQVFFVVISIFQKVWFQNSNYKASHLPSSKTSEMTPFFAKGGRDVNPPVISSSSQPLPTGNILSSSSSSPKATGESPDLTSLVDQVYEKIVLKLRMERDRRGIR